MTGQTSAGGGSFLSGFFPEKRLFIKSGKDTRFVRLTPRHQAVAWLAGTAVVAWSVVATSTLVIGLVTSGGAREQAVREQAMYENRLNTMAQERDAHRRAALDAQEKFDAALDDLARMQAQVFDAELRSEELSFQTNALRGVLQTTIHERDDSLTKLARLADSGESGDTTEFQSELASVETKLDYLTGALSRTATDRDGLKAATVKAQDRVIQLEHTARLNAERTDRIFSQLEEAVTVSMEPLDKMFRDVGMPPDQILRQMRQQYSGQGGPLTPIALSTMGGEEDFDSLRANNILAAMDELNLYRIATDKLPFATPVNSNVRQTSSFGYRRDPISGGRRLHAGTDWAGAYGTPLYATADGVVIHAGWQSGYGRLIKIQHAFGVETRYAHLSKITVKNGQRISRGDKIGAMGNSGRSTGTHLHYEVRVGGTPVNPLNYIKAARDVL